MLIWSHEGLAAMKRGTVELPVLEWYAAVRRAEELAQLEFLTVPGTPWDYQVEARHWRGAVAEIAEGATAARA